MPRQSLLPHETHEVMIPLASLWPRTTWLSRFVVHSTGASQERMLWVTQWGVWPSSENLPLFRRARSSYGEMRPLHEAPGHIFSRSEQDDLISFVQLCIICVWDFHLLPSDSVGARIFGSHDEFIHFFTRSDDAFASVTEGLSASGVEFTVVA